MARRTPLVLVADDDLNAAILLRHVLERDGYAVEIVRDGLAALEKARDLQPDLILLDVQMPHMNGFEVTTHLREDAKTARIPVVFVTAAARDPRDVVQGFQLGADDYIRKPYDYHELLARVASKIRAHQLEMRLQRRSEELEALVRIGAELNRRLGLDELTEFILLVARDELGGDYAELYLFDEQRQPTLYRDVEHGYRELQDARAAIEHPHSVAAQVYREEAPALFVNIADAPYLHANRYRSAIAAPLKHDEQLIGLLIVAHREPFFFSESDLRMLRSIGEQAALAVRNAQLLKALKRYTEDLEGMVEARTQALRAAQEQLMQSEKLAALGRLAAGVAHEVNNPLQPILSCLEGALEDIASGRPVDAEDLRVAETEVQRIKSIVSRLLEFSRPSEGKRVYVDMVALVQDTLALVKKRLEQVNVQVRTRFETVQPVLGIPTQLKQVVLNLILNAIESMPQGGTLWLEVSPSQDEGVLLHVADSGVGMDDETMAHIFEPFYSTKQDGTGLGLAVTYGIVQGHGGEIHVESSPGKGSRFTIWLPPAEKQTDPPETVA